MSVLVVIPVHNLVGPVQRLRLAVSIFPLVIRIQRHGQIAGHLVIGHIGQRVGIDGQQRRHPDHNGRVDKNIFPVLGIRILLQPFVLNVIQRADVGNHLTAVL